MSLFDVSFPDERLPVVPRLIMQTWKNEVVPEKWSSSPTSITRFMPEWDYVLMTDELNEKFVRENFPQYLDIYLSFPYAIQRADVIRYMWLYVNGGVYLDLDYELTEPLDQLFTSGSGLYLMTSSNLSSYFTNSFMASIPGHPFWLEVLEEMKELYYHPPWWAIGKHLSVMMSTGPGLLTQAARKTKHIHTLLPQRLVCPQTICKEHIQEQGILKPLEGSSWGGYDTHCYNWVYCNQREFAALLLAAILIIILIIVLIVMIVRSCR